MPSFALARSLQVDLMTAEIFAAFRSERVSAVLLKGPVIGRELYEHDAERTYADIDILVPEEARPVAEAVLESRGFGTAGLAGTPVRRSQHWLRTSDGCEVDLHRTFFGVRVTPGELWAALSPRIIGISVANQTVDALDRVGVCLIVTLHAAQHTGTPHSLEHPGEDLRRGIERWSVEVWREAVLLAERLDAIELFAVALQASSEGAILAKSLGLRVSAHAGLEATQEAWRQEAVGARATRMANISELPGFGERAAALARLVVPTPDELRLLDPRVGGGGPARLLVAYIRRIGALARNAPPTLLLWQRGRRARARIRTTR